jgi:hypothetical protein
VISFERHEIDWDRTCSWALSHGERCMLMLALKLYNGTGAFDLADMIDTVDIHNFTVAVVAIHIRYRGAEILELPA